jgi:hypothetical protein
MTTNSKKIDSIFRIVGNIEKHLEVLLKKSEGDFTRPKGKSTVGKKPKAKKVIKADKFVCSCKTDSDGNPTKTFTVNGIASHKKWAKAPEHTICEESVWMAKPVSERKKLKK